MKNATLQVDRVVCRRRGDTGINIDDPSEVSMRVPMRFVRGFSLVVGLLPFVASGSEDVQSDAMGRITEPLSIDASEGAAIRLAVDDTKAAGTASAIEVPDDTPLYAGVQVQQAGNTGGTFTVNGGSAESIDQVASGLDQQARRLGWVLTESTKSEAIGGEGRVLRYRKGGRKMDIFLAPGLDSPGTSVSINLMAST